MNKKGQKAVLGFALLAVMFIYIIGVVATIEPLKESLDSVRGNAALNCPSTPNFNQSDYDDDSESQRLTRRPVCFVTGLSMVYFVGTFIIAAFVWMISNWRRVSK